MRIKVTREALMRQIEEQAPHHGTMPPTLYLDGVEVLADDEVDSCARDHADVRAILTYIEWKIFRELCRCQGRTVGWTTFASLLRSRDGFKANHQLRNNVSCHIVHIRQKLHQHSLPYRIVAVRSVGMRLEKLYAGHEAHQGQN